MSRIRHFTLPLNALLLAALLVALMGAPAGATLPPAAAAPAPGGLSAGDWSSIQAQMRQASYYFTPQTVESAAKPSTVKASLSGGWPLFAKKSSPGL